MNEKNKIVSLTSLRFFMMLSIVFSHFEFIKQFLNDNTYRAIHNPTLAVNFFFVLSGFGLMFSDIKRNPNNSNNLSIKNSILFGINHIRRIYPLYLLITFLVFVIRLLIILKKNCMINNLKELVLQLFINIILMQSLTGTSYFSQAFNGVSWFLSSIFIIYFFCPLFIFILRNTVNNLRVAFVFLIINCFCIIILSHLFKWIQNNYLFISHPIDLLDYAFPGKRVFHVLQGMLICIIREKVFERLKKLSFSQFSSFEILITLFIILYHFVRWLIINQDLVQIIDIFLVVILLFIFSFEGGLISSILNNRYLIYLGNISMYLFLIHYPIRIYIVKVYDKIFNNNIGITILEMFSILILTFIFSILWEKTIKNFSNK